MTRGLAFDVAHALAAGVLLMSFALLIQRRLSRLLSVFALQAGLVAAAAGWQGHVQGAIELYLTAALALVLKAIAVPLLLRRIIRRLGIQHMVEPVLGVATTMLAGASLAALSIMLVLPVTQDSGALTREHLTLALAVVLLGLLVMITRRNAVSQVVGFMSIENGLILSAIGTSGMPLILEMSLAVSVLVLLLVFGILIFRIRERFDSVDVHHLEGFRGDRPAERH
jgi:hydrogenase-4 component E